MDLYRKEIIEHYKNPRNFGKIKNRTKSSCGDNPSCGDSISMDIVVEDGKIKDIKFSGDGCAISIASASMLTDKVKGKKLTDIAKLDLSFLQELMQINLNPSRVSCAILPLNVLKKLVLQELKS